MTESKEAIFIQEIEDTFMFNNDEYRFKKADIEREIEREMQRVRNFERIKNNESFTTIDIEQEFEVSKIDESNKSQIIPEFKQTEPTNYYRTLDVKNKLGFDENATIKGTIALKNREEVKNTFKTCFFSSIYALLYSINRSFDTMNFRNVDLIVDYGLKMADKFASAQALSFKKVLVDDKYYEINVEFIEFLMPQNFAKLLTKFCESKKYGIVKFKNFSVALIKENDKFYVFDSYDMDDFKKETEEGIEEKEEKNESYGKENSVENEENKEERVEKTHDEEKDENEENGESKEEKTEEVKENEEKKEQEEKELNKEKEKSSAKASWILFNEIENLLSYLKLRVFENNLNNDVKIYTIKIGSIRKASKKAKFAQIMLTTSLDTQECYKKDVNGQNSNKLMPEELLWVDGVKLPPWSRMKTVNYANQVCFI